jgi:hypothetical protein
MIATHESGILLKHCVYIPRLHLLEDANVAEVAPNHAGSAHLAVVVSPSFHQVPNEAHIRRIRQHTHLNMALPSKEILAHDAQGE